MKIASTLLTAATLSAGLLLATSNANAILIDQGATVYDNDLGISWLKNANLAATNSFSVSGINAVGAMNWNTAQSWIGAMNTANYLGYNDWRLPTTLQQDSSCLLQSGLQSHGFNCTGSEMGHLFYNELGGTARVPISSSSDPDLALFANLQSGSYWSGSSFPLYPNGAWNFTFGNGAQGSNLKPNELSALAVRPGQVAGPGNPVPEPATLLLLSLGLAGLAAVRRRKNP